jgi:hypothetical protein
MNHRSNNDTKQANAAANNNSNTKKQKANTATVAEGGQKGK